MKIPDFQHLSEVKWTFALHPSRMERNFLFTVRGASFLATPGGLDARSYCCVSEYKLYRERWSCANCGFSLTHGLQTEFCLKDPDVDGLSEWLDRDPLEAYLASSELFDLVNFVFALDDEEVEQFGDLTYDGGTDVHQEYYSFYEWGVYCLFSKFGMSLDRPIPYCHLEGAA